jgi:hypothetical protein
MSAEDGCFFVGPDDGQVLINPVGGRMAIKVLDEYT